MNIRIGKISSIVTLVSVLAFALSMIIGFFVDTLFISCFSSMFIALGFLPFMVSIFATNKDEDKKVVGLSGLLFGAIYVVIIFIVYYAQCTTINLNNSLSEETLSIISYAHIGSLFFNYDLLGYAFMALSTFLIGFTVVPKKKGDLAFKRLLLIHGIFFLSCLFIPMFPIFNPANESTVPGTFLLEFWCLYFTPICILGYRYFKNQENVN